jgi:hypothetical protein
LDLDLRGIEMPAKEQPDGEVFEIPGNPASTVGQTSRGLRLRPASVGGSTLGQAELVAMFGLLVNRMEWFERSGPVERLDSSVNGAVEPLPIRYRLIWRTMVREGARVRRQPNPRSDTSTGTET